MLRGTNSFHEPLHAADLSACGDRAKTMITTEALVAALRLVSGRRSRASIRGRNARSSGAVLRVASAGPQDVTLTTW